jgi:uracil-DNA glycosylase
MVSLATKMAKHQDGIEQLWREMHAAVSPFPPGVAEVPQPIKGTAFFPGGLGLWLHENASRGDFPTGQIMVVGQDFNSVKAYKEAVLAGTEVGSSATWRALQKLLCASDISFNRCFFTNLYMGLRKEGPETGKFPGAHDEPFVQRCMAFFVRQLEVVQPKLILTLGLEPIQVLAKHLLHVTAPKSLTSCVDIYRSVSLPHGRVTVVALTHPSFYHANVWRRRYGELTEAEAERAMIVDALKIAFPK